jgi:hypothetical protein
MYLQHAYKFGQFGEDIWFRILKVSCDHVVAVLIMIFIESEMKLMNLDLYMELRPTLLKSLFQNLLKEKPMND